MAAAMRAGPARALPRYAVRACVRACVRGARARIGGGNSSPAHRLVDPPFFRPPPGRHFPPSGRVLGGLGPWLLHGPSI